MGMGYYGIEVLQIANLDSSMVKKVPTVSLQNHDARGDILAPTKGTSLAAFR